MKKNKTKYYSMVDESIAEIISESDAEFVVEIITNNEQIWLEDFRWYRNKLEVAKTPKSSILCMQFWLEGFVRCHCEVAHKVIQTKRNTENFLDEYGTRWVSYSDLMMTLEDEFYYLEDAINNIYDNDSIEKEKHLNDEFIPKYSIFRMMCRIWGKYVMKRLLPAFSDQIKEMLSQYHSKLTSVANDYEVIMNSKFAKTKIKSKCSVDHVTRDLLLQSVQMIVDISLNEISINYIETTTVQMGIYYPKVETVIIQEISDFFDTIKSKLNPVQFENMSNIYFKEIRNIFPKTTQRKFRELLTSKQVGYWEETISKVYQDYLKLLEDDKNTDLECMTGLNIKSECDNLNHIFGKYHNERIHYWLKTLVAENQAGSMNNIIDISDEGSVSSDNSNEETKVDPYQRPVCVLSILIPLLCICILTPSIEVLPYSTLALR